MGEASDTVPSIADRLVADLWQRPGQQRRGRFDLLRPLGPGVRHARAHCQRAVVVTDVGELGQPCDVDQMLGRAEPQRHQRDEALAAREDLDVVVLGEERQRLLERLGPVVRESRQLHGERHHVRSLDAVPVRCA